MNLEITKYANSKYSTEYLAIEKMTKLFEEIENDIIE